VKLREPPRPWEWALGSEALTEIWEMGYRDLSDLQTPFQFSIFLVLSRKCSSLFRRPGDVNDFVKKVKQEDHRIALRKKQLQQAADRLAARLAAQAKPASPAPVPEAKEQQPAVGVALKTSDTASPIPPTTTLHPSLPAKPGSSAAQSPSTAHKKTTNRAT